MHEWDNYSSLGVSNLFEVGRNPYECTPSNRVSSDQGVHALLWSTFLNLELLASLGWLAKDVDNHEGSFKPFDYYFVYPGIYG
jgi:hypothetical protein